jgi:plastocyanin
MRARLSMIVATGVLATAGMGSSPSVASATCSGSPAPVAIGTSGFAFAPPEVTITTCTPVTWTLSGAHTATSDSSSTERFDLSGESGTHVFLRPGDYDFYCRFHRSLGMTGIVHVTGSDQDSPPTAALSAPSAAAAGQDVTIDGSASSDPDPGDTLLYRWDVDGDGTFERTTSSATTTTSFATAGPHTVHLQVVDDHGKGSAVAAATVVVPAPPSGGGGGGGSAPPFAGVKLSVTKVKVGANRIAAIRVACPAGAAGGCAGKLTLADRAKRVASKSFTAAAGKAATVKLRLSAAEARKLRRRHRLRLTLTIASHDGAGHVAPVRTAKVTLRRR